MALRLRVQSRALVAMTGNFPLSYRCKYDKNIDTTTTAAAAACSMAARIKLLPHR
jgi:hypothetical protein